MLTTLLAKWNSSTDLNLTYIVLHMIAGAFGIQVCLGFPRLATYRKFILQIYFFK